MSDIKRLVKAAEAFHYKAVFAQQSQSAMYATSIIRNMLGLAKGAVVSVDHLLRNPQYQKSFGLRAMKSLLPQLVSTLTGFSYQGSDDKFYQDLETLLGNLSAYSDRGNTGTGYDPITSTTSEGYTAPSYYVTYLMQLFQKLKSNRVIELDVPHGKDPIAVSLTQQENKSKQRT